MKIEKGEPGYLRAQKSRYLTWALVEFAIVAAVFILGYVQTGKKENLFTVAAIVGCLPAAKMLVEFITMYPHRGIEEEKYEEIEEKAPLITKTYDLLITSTGKGMPVEAAMCCAAIPAVRRPMKPGSLRRSRRCSRITGMTR